MGTDKLGIGDKMRPLSSLLSRHSTTPGQVPTDRNAKEAPDAAGASKTPPKRCLNEAGHKLYR